MRHVTVREFRNSSASVLDDVEQGETLVITRNGRPIAKVSPMPPDPGLNARQLVAMARRLPPVDFSALRADADAFFSDDDSLETGSPR